MSYRKNDRLELFRRYIAPLLVLLALMLPVAAPALDDVPDYKFLVFPNTPRGAGRPDDAGVVPAGDIRNYYEKIIETYWKEISYHEVTTNGLPFSIRGFYPDTKTYGYVLLPWAFAPETVRPDSWTSIYDIRIASPLYQNSGRFVSFGGEHNWETGDPLTPTSPGQLYSDNSPGASPLVDGVWTPGERFQDVNGNGQWDPAVPGSITPPITNITTNIVVGDDWWDSSNTNMFRVIPPGPPIVGLQGQVGGSPDLRGEYYADYNGNTLTIPVATNPAFSQATWPGFDPSVTIFIAAANNLSNLAVTVSEFDLTPGNGTPSDEGDFDWTNRVDLNRLPAPNPVVNVASNGSFDFQVDPITGMPLVFTPSSVANPAVPRTVTYWQLVGTNGTPYQGVDAQADGAVLRQVSVPVYQSTELWGQETLPGVFMGQGPTWVVGIYEVVTNITPGIVIPPIEEEPFEDFISWWIPYAGQDGLGTWLGGVVGGPITAAHMPNLAEDNWITWAEYQKYINDNYPGNTAALIARAGNGRYDGPDNWCERLNNKMQIQGSVANLTTPPPGPWWDPRNWYGGAAGWRNWWTGTFGSAPPTTFGSPWNMSFGDNWWPGWEIPNCVEYVQPDPTPPPAPSSVQSEFMVLGDGINTVLSGTLANQNVVPGTLSINGGTWAFTDNEDGTLTGTAGALGTISYATGVWSLDFAGTAPAAGVQFTGAYSYTVGSGTWYPDLNTTWTYDAPREYQDMPSAIYHINNTEYTRGDYANDPYPSGGDLRLGEITSPWGNDMYGQDLGSGIPGSPRGSTPDGNIPSAGPLSYNGSAQFSFDANNQLSLEVATWRTDGRAFTGPRSPVVSRGNGLDRILYGGDHRDLNLNGLIDLGETIPPNSYSYTVDDSTAPEDGGHPSMCAYPFNHDRYCEDAVQAWDYAEDFASVVRYNTLALDVVLSSTNLVPLAAGIPLANVVGKANGIPHAGYLVGDSVWIDANANTLYDVSAGLNEPSGSIAVGTVGTLLANAIYMDVDASLSFTLGTDNAWVDAPADGVFTSELVLNDAGSLMNGTVGIAINTANPLTVVCYRDVGTPAGYQYGDDVWIEYPGVLATNGTPLVYDTNDMAVVSWGGGIPIGAVASGTIPNVLYHANRSAGELTGGPQLRDDIWIDGVANLTFDCDEVLSRGSRFIYAWLDSRALTNGTPGAAMANVYYANENVTAGYQQSGDSSWYSSIATPNFMASETVVAGPALPLGTAKSYNLLTAAYNDFNGSAAYEFGTDPVWLDTDGDLQYAAAGNIRIPVYFCGLQTEVPGGEGSVPAGEMFAVNTRDEDTPLAGYMHIMQPTVDGDHNVSDGAMQHEIGHDIHGWPDLYDYDRFDPNANGFMNQPIGGFDLMAGGGLVHGVPAMKESAYQLGHTGQSWIDPVDLTTVLPLDGGARTLRMYPVERHRNQYYYIVNPFNPGEVMWFYYQSGTAANPFSNFADIGGQGLHIGHDDNPGRFAAMPPQQRQNGHYTWQIVQADGLYELEDGINLGHNADVWPGTTLNYSFTADSIPGARWWDQSDIGIRITDVRLPATATDPVEVDIEYYSTTAPWVYPASGADTDGDGIPDVWEYHYFGLLSMADASTDWDHDGLSDLGEYLSGTDPKSHEGLSNDAFADTDGDTLSNWEEVNIFNTLPSVTDTDDDTIPDGEEVDPLITKITGRRLTSPIDSRSPLVQRSLLLGVAPIPVPGIQLGSSTDRFDLATWTIECWVKRPQAPDSGNLITRVTERGQTNFCLRIASGIPLVEFTTETGHRYFAGANVAIPVGVWTHLAGVWNPADDTLQLYVNGVEFQAQVSLQECGQGFGDTTIGSFDGAYLDSVRIWGYARTAAEIVGGMYDLDGTAVSSSAGTNTTGSSSSRLSFGGHEYEFVTDRLSWDQARDSAIAKGGHLAIIETAAENAFLAANITMTSFIGASDAASPGQWVWLDGNDLAAGYQNWAPSTTQLAAEDYLVMEGPEEQLAGLWESRTIDANGGSYGHIIEYDSASGGGSVVTVVTSAPPIACYLFDDGGVTAEDFVHRLDWDYALAGGNVVTNDYVLVFKEFDSDNDGLPDWWEKLYFGDATSADPAADLDSDGLNNLYEFYCDTNPLDSDTDNNAKLDGSEDYDGDGLENQDEQTHGADPRLQDTDDDGLTDLEEKLLATDPANSLSPANQRALALPGDASSYLEMPIATRFGLTSFTIEAWVKPAAAGGTVIRRTVDAATTNYFMEVNASSNLVAGFGTNILVATNAFVLADGSNWTHVAATYQVAGQHLRLYVDGAEVAHKICSAEPRFSSFGPTIQRIGEGFNGCIDEVRIWSVTLSESELVAGMISTLTNSPAGLVAYYRFDDGTSYSSGVSGTSLNPLWTWGQVEDFVAAYGSDWENAWRDAATLYGSAAFTNLTQASSPVMDASSPDIDGDGLLNWQELALGTDPYQVDTDDDGFSDFTEVNGSITKPGGISVSSPLYSRSPLISRSMVLSGSPVLVPGPKVLDSATSNLVERFYNLDKWAIGCWVRTTSNETGSLIYRFTATGGTNFDLFVSNNVPGIRFTSVDGILYSLSAPGPIPTNKWVSLLAWLQPSIQRLTLYVDDVQVAGRTIISQSSYGDGNTYIDNGVVGYIDDVYIADTLPGLSAQPDFVLVLDSSGSMMGQPLIDLQAAANASIDALPDGSQMAIIAFGVSGANPSGGGTNSIGFTSDKAALKSAVAALTADDGTDFNSPLQMLVTLFSNTAADRKRVAIFVSDGGSALDPATVLSVSNANIVVNTIGVTGADATTLTEIANGTGGAYYPAPTAAQLAEIMSSLVVSEAKSAAFYPFDDGGVTAEDYEHQLDWDYALAGITFDATTYNTRQGLFNWMYTDSKTQLPDWWKSFFFGEDAVVATADPDKDGLDNLHEYLSGTSPLLPDSNGNLLLDGAEDLDGDGVSNGQEETAGTDPTSVDTDDDGLSDRQELDQGTNPLDSVSPYVMRYVRNDGKGWLEAPGEIIGVDSTGARYDLDKWTIEAAVKLEALPTNNVVLIHRGAQPYDYATYELGIGTNLYPYVRFQTAIGTEYKVEGYVPVETNKWTFLGGWWGEDERGGNNTQLALLQNGIRRERDVANVSPARGPQNGPLIMASNLVGCIDEVRIWAGAQTEEDMRRRQGKTLLFGQEVASMGTLLPAGGRLTRLIGGEPARLGDDFTVEAWFKTEGSGVIVQREAGLADDSEILYNFNIYVTPGGLAEVKWDVYDLVLIDGPVWRWGTITMGGQSIVNDGQWHHVAFVHSAAGMAGNGGGTLYVDGLMEGQTFYYRPIDRIDWHVGPGETQPTDYVLPSPQHIRATDVGALHMGMGFVGSVDEVAFYNTERTDVQVLEEMYSKASTVGLVSYFDFDNILIGEGGMVPDSFSKTSVSLNARLFGEATVDFSKGVNAPIHATPLDVLNTMLVAYWPFDDGRWTNRTDMTGCMEDFRHRLDWEYAATPMPSTNNIDCALFSSTNWHDVSNPYAGYEPAMAYPGLFPLSLGDSPWQFDSDGDGMPDSFEVYFGLDPNRIETPEDRDLEAYGDIDGDGLYNLYEYYAGTDPTFHDSNGNGIDDGEEDSDGDGVSNIDEQRFGSHPGRLDSDDDGFPDEVEIGAAVQSAPADSMDPKDYYASGRALTDRRYAFKSMVLDGQRYQIPAPEDARRFNAESWTVECWVRPTNSAASGALVSCEGNYWTNGVIMPISFHELGLTNGYPYAQYQNAEGAIVRTPASRALPLGEWTHLAEVYDKQTMSFILYRDGVEIAKIAAARSPMMGTPTSDKWPGKAYVGGSGVLGNIDEVRIWNLARTADQVLRGTREMVQLYDLGQVCNFRFDDGRAMDASTNEVPDGFGVDDGQGAEDYANRPTRSDLENCWRYSLRGITFDYTNAVLFGADQFDDKDGDGLPDWWEDIRFNATLTYYAPVRDTAGTVIDGIQRTETVGGGDSALFHAAYLGWSIDYTPIVTIPDQRWTIEPDAAWMIKDFLVPVDYRFAEMKLALSVDADTLVYFNGKPFDLADPGVRVSPGRFVIPPAAAANTYYVPNEVLQGYLLPGRNRISIQIINNNGIAAEEYMNMELYVDGTQYLVRMGDDPLTREDPSQSRWWVYAHPGTLMEPPFDNNGRQWFEKDYALDSIQDIDDDGLNTLGEYLCGTDPHSPDTDNNGTRDIDEDFDGDGLSNSDELFWLGSDPRAADTDNDGISDGQEIHNRQLHGITGPTDSHSPEVPRSLTMAGRNLRAYDPGRFRFLPVTTVSNGPIVTITAPADGDQIDVRFTDLTGSVRSSLAIASTRLYANGNFVENLALDGSKQFATTTIIRSGSNVLTVVATDVEGGVGQATVTVTGTFAPADIRVTQIWDQPGDLDTWLIDPQGRHMGWTATGPGLPQDAGANQRIPRAVLDIDDTQGIGPENITLEQGFAIAGDYPVWMNNFANQGNANSTVRVLVHEGQPNERYVEFGPQAMPTSDGNGNNAAAWWNTTVISWPSGDMSPPGTPVGGTATNGDPGVGISADVGWTVEGWINPLAAAQSGAMAVYRSGTQELFMVGLSNNCPIMRVTSATLRRFELVGLTIPTNHWTHIAAVYSKSQKSIRLHVDGVLAAALLMPESRREDSGNLYIDSDLDGMSFTAALADEIRFWNVARNGGLISSQKHLLVSNMKTLVAQYSFDDGGSGIEDGSYATNRLYDLSYLNSRLLPDVNTDAKPGPDGIWGTGDDIAAGAGADGQNDLVTCTDAAPVYGLRDRDNDGMPDWFELVYGGSTTGMEANKDDDSDGLLNLSEFLCGTSPVDIDTDGNGIPDTEEDFDGDGVDNLAEQDAGTDSRLIDTDDDGFPDIQEIRFGSNGAESADPAYLHSVAFDGAMTSYVRAPASPEYALRSFDISAWVCPVLLPATEAEIVARDVEANGSGSYYNYFLGINSNGVPFIRFTAGDDQSDVVLSAPGFLKLRMNGWTYLRATFDETTSSLALYVGSLDAAVTQVAFVNTAKRPKTVGLSPVELRIGAGFNGLIDNVLIKGAPDTVLDYRFNDGTAPGMTSGTEGWTGQSGPLGRVPAGQVEDSTVAPGDWLNHWLNAGTLVGGAMFSDRDVSSVYPAQSDLDTDQDGLPDDWEIANGFNPFAMDTNGNGISDALEDNDLDGQDNLNEYLAGTNPNNPETTPGRPDGQVDTDGDGLNNRLEQDGRSDPKRVDTDDDGISDINEVRGTSLAYPGWYTLPNDSLSPARAGVLRISGINQYVEIPTNQPRISLENSWTVEAWVNIDPAFGGTGTLVRRAVGSMVNYELGIAAGLPYVRFAGVYNSSIYPVQATGTVVLNRRNQWYHLAGVYDEDAGELRLLVDGSVVATADASVHPSLVDGAGVAVARVGEGFRGLIDEVRIWNTAASATNIAMYAYQPVEGLKDVPVLYYKFDDGPFGLSTYTTTAVFTNYSGSVSTQLYLNATVEDFAVPPEDWKNNWSHAGKLVNATMIEAANTPIPAAALADEDNDELPDSWEFAAFGSISSQNGQDNTDNDGLSNYYEYRAHLNPRAEKTFSDGINDANRDSDGDGLTNLSEQNAQTLPDKADTDDDGVSDTEEVTGITSAGVHVGVKDPLNSLKPIALRSLSLDGNSRVVVPAQARHSMETEWTLAAWVWPSNAANGIVVARLLSDTAANYELGVVSGGGTLYPYTRYTGMFNGSTNDVRVQYGVANVTFINATNKHAQIAAQEWSHLAASYSAASNTLSLFVNGELVAWRIDAMEVPLTGSGPNLPLGGELVIGGGRRTIAGTGVADGFEGYIDDVRIAAKAFSANEIKQMALGEVVVTGGSSTNTIGSAHASSAAVAAAAPCAPDELLIGLRPDISQAAIAGEMGGLGLQMVKGYKIISAIHVKITDGAELKAKIAALKADKRFTFVEPNYTLQLFGTIPTDAMFDQQWGLHNTGQNGGTTNADINAPVAWDISTGGDIVVAVIDTGVDVTHPDLVGNMWHNTGEIPGNEIDDDGNGYTDDYYGFNFAAANPQLNINGSPDVSDLVGHGTHCAGIIGAVGNNALGVCGVNWKVKIMALKIADARGNLSVDAAVNAIQYAWQMGARISNNSWGGYGYSQALYDAIKVAGENDHLFVAAAANDGLDNDVTPAFPASYDLDNIIAVAATDNRDALADFSNYGARTVDLGAPGVDIMSTLPTNEVPMGQDYGLSSGTSMATPHVAGAAALVLSVDGRLSSIAVKAALLNNVDPDPALAGRTLTGGRLDIGNVLLNTASGAGIAHGLVAWFRFDDGGLNAQDFTLTKDWRRDWWYAGQLDGAHFSDFAHEPTGDSDGDGMPDWWEEAMGLDPRSGANEDSDGDGLTDFYEYLSGTDPYLVDSDNNGISDYDEDGVDHDGIPNGAEQDLFATDPSHADTDDDGLGDSLEIAGASDPRDSRSPYVMRALRFGGGAGTTNTVVVSDKIDGMNTDRFSLPVWTLEMFINPDSIPAGTATCPLLSRAVDRTGKLNYEIGITNGSLYVRLDIRDTSSSAMVIGGRPLTANKWTHVAARCDGNALTLFVDGETVGSTDGQLECAVGPGDLTIGSQGFVGRIMGVRVWKIAQKNETIKELYRKNLFFGDVSTLGGYLRVGGGGLVKESATTLAVPPVDANTIDMLVENWTLEGWVRTTGDGIVIARRNDSLAATDNYNYYLGVQNGTLIGRFAMEWLWFDMFGNLHVERDLVGNNLVGEIFVADGQWHHVAYIRRNDGCYLYVDGVLDAKQERILPPGGSIREYILSFYGPVVMGMNLAGDLDELRIWDRGLTAAELKDVGSRNLSGTEQGLVSYFNFDFQTGELADERAARRNPVEEYGVYIGDAELIKGDSDGPVIVMDLLRTFSRVALVGYFSANDGGTTVEDYINPMGVSPFRGVKYAGRLGAAVSFVDLGADVPYIADGDSDGLPDTWESAWGLDPNSALGDNGTWGDPDTDGLNNRAEFLAGTDPRDFDTLDTGFSDYDNRASPTNRTFGELYADGDGMMDSWEVQYPSMLTPLLYDGNQDPDGDGWSNYAEFMFNEAGVVKTDPTDMTLYPTPFITFKIGYTGINGGGPVIVNAYDSGRMDGIPMASVTVTNTGLPFEARLNKFDTGHLREGQAWFFAFVDNDGDGSWSYGEPAGLVQWQPVNVSWGEIPPVTIELTDLAPPGYTRFAWPMADGTNSYSVSIRRTSSLGSPIVFTRTITGRNYLHEGDLMFAGIYGLDPGASMTPGFQWFAGSATGVFSMAWSANPSMPTAVWPLGGELVFAQNRFDWRMDTNATRFQIQISTNPLFTTTVVNLVTNAPRPNASGISSYVPFDGNSGVLSNGLSYFWRVRSYTPYTNSAWMTNSSFRLILLESLAGAYTVSGEVYYFGKVTNFNIIVELSESRGFSGLPVSRTVLTKPGVFTFMGLRPGGYYLRAFIDQNKSGTLDAWESFGFTKEIGMFANDYDPQRLGVPGNIKDKRIVLRDRDTDDDRIPDAWEYENFGSLLTAGAGSVYGSPGYTDTDGDGVNDLHEYELGTNPRNTDSDGDGLSDGVEVYWTGGGMSPTNPDDDTDSIPTSVEIMWNGVAGYQAGGDMNPSLSDSDGDGVADLMEIAAGSNPASAASKGTVGFSQITLDGSGRPVIKWNVHSNTRSLKVRYYVQRSMDLITWEDIGSALSTGTINVEVSVTDTTAANRVYFYRLRLVYEP